MPFTRKRASVTLWIIQGVLAALFLFAGGFKLVLSPQALARLTPLPIPFMKFIGLCEVTGGLGLILPGLLRVRTELTPLAAGGLAIIMLGAVAVTIAMLGVTQAVLPLIVGSLAATVAVGRWPQAWQVRAPRPAIS